MQIPPNAIQEFQQLWKKHYHQELSPEQAKIKASDVLNLYLLAQGKDLL